jgi:hypothetical protein
MFKKTVIKSRIVWDEEKEFEKKNQGIVMPQLSRIWSRSFTQGVPTVG